MTDAEQLLAALDAANDDAERAALLAANSHRMRKELRSLLAYRKFIADCAASCAAEKAAFERFSRGLNDAPDDAARLSLIESARADPQRGPSFVAEWTWRQGATVDDWSRRYLAAIGCG